jgi:hypothetical protein
MIEAAPQQELDGFAALPGIGEPGAPIAARNQFACLGRPVGFAGFQRQRDLFGGQSVRGKFGADPLWAISCGGTCACERTGESAIVLIADLDKPIECLLGPIGLRTTIGQFALELVPRMLAPNQQLERFLVGVDGRHRSRRVVRCTDARSTRFHRCHRRIPESMQCVMSSTTVPRSICSKNQLRGSTKSFDQIRLGQLVLDKIRLNE